VCSEHSLKGRGPEERLGRPSASSPSPGTRSRFRAVAMVARSLGQLSVQSIPSTGDASVKQPGMNYRYEGPMTLLGGGYPFPLPACKSHSTSLGQFVLRCGGGGGT
jgi:hypothetical protein